MGNGYDIIDHSFDAVVLGAGGMVDNIVAIEIGKAHV